MTGESMRAGHKVRKMRHVRPKYPHPCASCGRTARRMIRTREITSDATTGQRLGVRVLMVPYCATCTPAERATS